MSLILVGVKVRFKLVISMVCFEGLGFWRVDKKVKNPKKVRMGNLFFGFKGVSWWVYGGGVPLSKCKY